MAKRFVLILLALAAAWAADDAWAKVKALKTGTDIRVYKIGSAQPIVAQSADLTDDNLIVIVKKTETAIPRNQIDHIEARGVGKPATTETTSKEGVNADGTPSSSTSTNHSFGSKGDFEVVYRRPAGAPKKQ